VFPVVGRGAVLVGGALVAGEDLAAVDGASHSLHVGHDEDPETGLMWNGLVAVRRRAGALGMEGQGRSHTQGHGHDE